MPNEPPADPPGYQVVDMLPPPAMCSGLAASTDISGAFVPGDDGWMVDVRLGAPRVAGGRFVVDTLPSSADGVISAVVETPEGGLNFHWSPARAERQTGTVLVPATCPTGQQFVLITLLLGPLQDRHEGAPVHVVQRDTYRY